MLGMIKDLRINTDILLYTVNLHISRNIAMNCLITHGVGGPICYVSKTLQYLIKIKLANKQIVKLIHNLNFENQIPLSIVKYISKYQEMIDLS